MGSSSSDDSGGDADDWKPTKADFEYFEARHHELEEEGRRAEEEFRREREADGD
jgi:hypothetical protein